MRIRENLTGEREDIFLNITTFNIFDLKSKLIIKILVTFFSNEISRIWKYFNHFYLQPLKILASSHKEGFKDMTHLRGLAQTLLLQFNLNPDSIRRVKINSKHIHILPISFNTCEPKLSSKQRKLGEPLKVTNLLSLHKRNNRI